MISIPEIKFRFENTKNITYAVSEYSDLQNVLLQYNTSLPEIRASMCQQRKKIYSEKTILLIPYRNRTENLKLFFSPIHKHLINQVRNCRPVCSNIFNSEYKN